MRPLGFTKWNQSQALPIGKQLPRRELPIGCEWLLASILLLFEYHRIFVFRATNDANAGEEEEEKNKKNNFRRDYESGTVTNATLKQWKNISRPYGTVRATADGRQFYIAFFMSTAILCHIFFLSLFTIAVHRCMASFVVCVVDGVVQKRKHKE